MNNERYSAESYDELLNKYHTLIKVCKIVMHDIRSPLRFLGDIAGGLNVDNLDKPDSVDSRNLALLKETSSNLSLFVSNTVDWFMNNNMGISIVKEKVDLSLIAEEVIRIYEKPMKAKNNTLVREFDEPVYVYSNKETSSIIIRNAIDNANKYTSNGEIRVIIRRKQGETMFCIADNGAGFDYKKLLKNLQDTSSHLSQHIGFRIIHDLAIQLGLTYRLKSEPGVGTRFSLLYPESVNTPPAEVREACTVAAVDSVKDRHTPIQNNRRAKAQ